MRGRDSVASISLLIAILISGIATFAIYPLLTLHLLNKGQGLEQIGLILGVLSGVGRLCAVLLGEINNKAGTKITTCLGLLLRAIGISVFLFDTSVSFYVLFSALASLGSSATALGIKSELMRVSATRKYVTLRSMAINFGAIAGPALGAGLYYISSFTTILIGSVAAYVLLALYLACLTFSPPEKNVLVGAAKEAEITNMAQPDMDSAADKEAGVGTNRVVSRISRLHCMWQWDFVGILCIAGLYWFIYSQWSLVVPLQAASILGAEEASNGVYVANAVIVLVLQYPILVIALKNVRDKSILLIGFLCFLPAFVILLVYAGVAQVLIFCCFFSLGELLVSPTLDTQTAQLAPRSVGVTRAYGIQDSVTGVCSIVGSALGGMLIGEWGSVAGAAMMCIPAAFIAIVCVFLLKSAEVDSR